MKAILAVLVLFGILAALPEDKTLSASKKLISVSASQYYNEYQVNAEKANKKYKHKKVQITGRVSYVNSSCPDNPYVMVDGVECSMDSPEAMKSFSVGKRISISGKGAGAAMNIPFLMDCAIVSRK